VLWQKETLTRPRSVRQRISTSYVPPTNSLGEASYLSYRHCINGHGLILQWRRLYAFRPYLQFYPDLQAAVSSAINKTGETTQGHEDCQKVSGWGSHSDSRPRTAIRTPRSRSRFSSWKVCRSAELTSVPWTSHVCDGRHRVCGAFWPVCRTIHSPRHRRILRGSFRLACSRLYGKASSNGNAGVERQVSNDQSPSI